MRLDDWTTVTRAHTVAEPTCDAQLVSDVALRLLREYAPARPVRLLGVRVAGLGPSAAPAHGGAAEPREPGSGEPGGGEPADQLALPV